MKIIFYLLAPATAAYVLISLFIFISRQRNIKWFKTPSSEGKFAHAHGKKIFYRVKGKGEPVVVVLNAIGSSQSEWWPIQNEVGSKYRMITWDRAGYGWSTVEEGSGSATPITDELNMILKFERVKKPIYLVAHGTGTLYAMHYATTHPQNVAGVLFINPLPLQFSHWLNIVNENEECFNPFEIALGLEKKASKGFLRLLPVFKGYHLDRRYRRHIIEHYTRLENYETMQQEFSKIQESLNKIEAAGPFPPIPLKVLFPANESLIREWIRKGITEYSARKLGRIHHELAQDILKLSPKTTCYEIAGSGEYIHLSKPDLVVKSIFELIDE